MSATSYQASLIPTLAISKEQWHEDLRFHATELSNYKNKQSVLARDHAWTGASSRAQLFYGVNRRRFLNFSSRTFTLRFRIFLENSLLLQRDFVGYMAGEIVKGLISSKMIEADAPEELIARIRHNMIDEISVEDRLNEDVRQILSQHADEMRRTGVSYQEMYKKVKGQLARDRKLILR